MPRTFTGKRPIKSNRIGRLQKIPLLLKSEIPKTDIYDSMVTDDEVSAKMETMQINFKWRTPKENLPILDALLEKLDKEIGIPIFQELSEEMTKTGPKNEFRNFNPNTFLKLRILSEDKAIRNFIPKRDLSMHGTKKYLVFEDAPRAVVDNQKEYLIVDRTKWEILCNHPEMKDEIYQEIQMGTIYENDCFFVNMESLMRLHPRIDIQDLLIY